MIGGGSVRHGYRFRRGKFPSNLTLKFFPTLKPTIFNAMASGGGRYRRSAVAPPGASVSCYLDPHPTPTPPVARMGPTGRVALDSAQAVRTELASVPGTTFHSPNCCPYHQYLMSWQMNLGSLWCVSAGLVRIMVDQMIAHATAQCDVRQGQGDDAPPRAHCQHGRGGLLL
jgi:hypothetical protein